MNFKARFKLYYKNESDQLQAAVWIKDTLGTKITGSNGDSTGNISFETVDTTFNNMVDTIIAVKEQLGLNMEWYNWEIEVV